MNPCFFKPGQKPLYTKTSIALHKKRDKSAAQIKKCGTKRGSFGHKKALTHHRVSAILFQTVIRPVLRNPAHSKKHPKFLC